MKNLIPILIISTIPYIIINFILWSYITELISYPNDFIMLIGFGLLTLTITSNFYLIKFLIYKIKKNEKNNINTNS
jgi:hypothetical protein